MQLEVTGDKHLESNASIRWIDMQPGMMVGSYRILEQIGLGGMATVFKAYDPGTDRYVAIKIVSPQFAQDAEFRERFQREAKSIARLEHPHIIPVHAFGEEGDITYLVLRYMDTGTLGDLMNEHPMDVDKAVRMIDQIAGALDYAHRNGVIHRDVKPSNVLVDAEGNTYLTDFGIAKIVDATVDLTGTGTAMGTPQYMSPEQCRGDKNLTPATDIYSLGVVLYQLATGSLPFDAETPLAVIYKHLNDPLPPPRKINPQISDKMERVLLKALAKDPDDRYETAAEFGAGVRKAGRDARQVTPPPPSVGDAVTVREPSGFKGGLRRYWWIGALLAGFGAVALLVFSQLDRPESGDQFVESAAATDLTSKATPLPAEVGVQTQVPTPQIEARILADLNPAPTILEDPLAYNEHFYSITIERTSWDEAVRLARDLGADLVTINDDLENGFVRESFRARDPESGDFLWLGMSDARREGVFEWLNGDPPTYTNWSQGEPNNGGGGQDCVHMVFSGLWDDVECEPELFALLEFERLPSDQAAPDFAAAQAISANLGLGGSEHGLGQLEFEGDGLTKPSFIGGRDVRVTVPGGTPGRYFYFHVDPSFIFMEESEVLVSVEYFDEGFHAFSLEYDSTDSRAPDSGVFKRTESAQLENSGEWRVAVFVLEDAYFADRQADGADFRIDAGGDNDLYIDRVSVARSGSAIAEAIADPWGHVFVRPGESIVLGIIAAFGSSEVGQLAVDQVDAARLAVMQFGLIRGFPVELLEMDSGCSPEGGRAAANEIVQHDLSAIVGTTCSVALEEAMNVFEAARVVFISPSATENHLSLSGIETFNRTVFPESILPSPESFEIDPSNPNYQEFAAAFEGAYSRPCCEPTAAEAYDAAAILLNAIQAVAVLDEAGSLVIPRQMLAAVVRETRGFPGVSGEIYFDAVGDRVMP